MSKLDALERMLAAGTPRPWRWRHELGALCASNGDIVLWPDNALRPAECETVAQWMGACGQHAETRADTNSALIVSAVNNLPALIRIARAAEAWRDKECYDADDRADRDAALHAAIESALSALEVTSE